MSVFHKNNRKYIAGCLLYFYLSGIFSPLVVNAAHIFHHIITHTLHLHSDEDHAHHYQTQNHQQDHENHSIPEHGHEHSELLDKALQLLNNNRDKEYHPNGIIQFNRLFEHMGDRAPKWCNNPIKKTGVLSLNGSPELSETHSEPPTPPPKNDFINIDSKNQVKMPIKSCVESAQTQHSTCNF